MVKLLIRELVTEFAENKVFALHFTSLVVGFVT